MKRTIYIILLFTIVACSNETKQVIFKVHNNVDKPITNIKISNSVNDVYIDTIEVNKNKSSILKFKNVPKIDGGYSLDYELNSKYYFKNFGYYSNGIPSGSSYHIEIYKDTLIIRELFD